MGPQTHTLKQGTLGGVGHRHRDGQKRKGKTSIHYKHLLITCVGDADVFGLLCERFWGCCVSHGTEQRLQQDSEENNRVVLLFLQTDAPLRTHGAQPSLEASW